MKLKANGLRLGNIIRYRDERNTIVASIGDNFNTNHINKGYLVGSDCIEEYEPIPLTKEWLHKLGFEHYESKEKEQTMHFIAPFSIYSDKYKPNEFYISEGCIAKVVKYVHQLQNIYSALQDKELAL